MKALPPVLALCLSLGCGLPGEGKPCTDSNKCGAGLTCTNDDSGGTVCLRDCAASDVTCDDGLACLRLTGGDEAAGVCWPGGSTAHGEPCTGGKQCEAGGVCVNAGDGARCAQACKPGSTGFCAAGEVCVTTTTGGYCRPG